MRKDDDKEHGGWTAMLTDIRVVASIAAIIVGIAAMIAVMSRDPVQENDHRVDQETRSGQVSQVAQAPDGTTVWAVRTHGRLVIFSKGSIATIPG